MEKIIDEPVVPLLDSSYEDHVEAQRRIARCGMQLVLAEQLEPVIYSFALPGALPPMGGDNPRQYPPVARATPDALATALAVGRGPSSLEPLPPSAGHGAIG